MPDQPPADPDERTVDVLGEPYVVETFALPDDDEGAVVATLVSRAAERPTRRAVLHVHGFADYFFQTPAADYWTARGYDFYALDLRKYGRSLREHQTPNFVTDLTAYYEELDEAYSRIVDRDGHDHVVVSAHSTGGLITPLWVHDRQPAVAALVLNSPWLDLQGSLLLRTAGTKAIDQIGARRPYLAIPRDVSGYYARSLHREHDGEWEFDLAWKPLTSWPVYAGWLRAVRRGHARAHRGLDLSAPVLVLTSLPGFHKVMGPLLRDPETGADTVVWLAATDPAPGGGQFWHDRAVRPEHWFGTNRSSDEDLQRLWTYVLDAAGPA